jgi:hypothetical protein
MALRRHLLPISDIGTFETCRPAVTVSASGEDRKSSAEGQTHAIGTKRTWPNVRVESAMRTIVLKNSFWGDERNFLELLIRIERGDVRDHIDLSKIDHGPW